MGSVLAQEEVDALLAGVAGEEIDIEEEEDEYDPTEVIPFDLTAQDRIIRGRMPTLEIHSRPFCPPVQAFTLHGITQSRGHQRPFHRTDQIRRIYQNAAGTLFDEPVPDDSAQGECDYGA